LNWGSAVAFLDVKTNEQMTGVTGEDAAMGH
jgi:hypothetical protein